MRAAAVFFILCLAGCASHAHLYGPVDESGRLRLRSEGVVDLRPKGTWERKPALHLKATLVNDSSETWTFDPKEQTVIYPDVGRAPATALDEKQSAPIEVRAGESRTADLYFFLPPEEEKLEEFDVQWKIGTPGKPITSTTGFTKLKERSEPGYYPYTGFGAGFYDYGPRYYYRPSIRVRR